MERVLTLEDLQLYFDLARDNLSRERKSILSVCALPDEFNREAYTFSYMRAERLELEIIESCLEEVSWLPMQLDPQAEILLENKLTIKRWLASSAQGQPSSVHFGNDFIHALTRVALMKGWESPEFRSFARRIGELFHDLSCLIGLIYYGVWMAENGIVCIPVSDPADLGRTVKEISEITRSPEIAQYIADRRSSLLNDKKKGPPSLRVVDNVDWTGGPQAN